MGLATIKYLGKHPDHLEGLKMTRQRIHVRIRNGMPFTAGSRIVETKPEKDDDQVNLLDTKKEEVKEDDFEQDEIEEQDIPLDVKVEEKEDNGVEIEVKPSGD